jgi:hypothetical protein
MKTMSHTGADTGCLARAALTAALLAGSIASLAVISSVQGREQAGADARITAPSVPWLAPTQMKSGYLTQQLDLTHASMERLVRKCPILLQSSPGGHCNKINQCACADLN